MSNKTTAKLKFTFLQFALVILTLGVGSYSTLAQAKEPAGIIKLVRGDVKILDAATKKVVADPSGKRGRATKKGAPFYEGETIQTAASARVKLEFVEGKNSVVLGPGTSLVISRAGDGASKKGTDLELTKGTVRSTVNAKYSAKGDDVFQVKTPNAVAGVRGTIFNVQFDIKTAKTKVVTVEGLVSLMNRKPTQQGSGGNRFNDNNRGEVLVAAGSKSEMSADADAPTPPQKASQQEIEQSEQMESSVEESDEGEAEASPQTAANSQESEESEAESDGASGAEGNSENSQETADSEATESDKPENEQASNENGSESPGDTPGEPAPENETARNENDKPAEGDSNRENSQPRQEPAPLVENDDGGLPPVALAPEPSDSMNESPSAGASRGPASVDSNGAPRVEGPATDVSSGVSSPSMMMPGGEEFAFEGPAAGAGGTPFDIINKRTKEQLNSSAKERDRTNQTAGSSSTIRVRIE